MDELEDTRLREISQAQKTNMVRLGCSTRNGKIHRKESRIMAVSRWQEGGMEVFFNEHRASVLQEEKSSGKCLHSNVNALNTTEMHT